ncbi:MAG: NADH-ubiquinone dehydrogenase [Rhizobiaceae bacterium]
MNTTSGPDMMPPGLPKEVAGAINLAAHPAAGVMALSAVGLGLWSHAFGVWMGTASAMAELSMRAMSGIEHEKAVAPAAKPAPRTEAVVKTMMADAAQVADAAVETVARTAAPARRVAKRVSKPAMPAAAEAVRQPKGIGRPRKVDDLKAIAGVGPKLETVLNGLGIWTYRQIAGWSAGEIAWLDDYLSFSGRIERDDWIGQAKALSKGRRHG